MANEVGNTELVATKQELIAEIAQRALIEQSRLLSTVRDVSQFAVKGASTISFPNYTTLFSVENRASATAGANQQSTFGKDQLDLDVRAHIQWLIDSDDELESTLDVQAEYIRQASQAHAAEIDSRMITEMEAAAITTTTAGALTQDVVLEMRQILLQNKANPSQLFVAVSPAQEANLLKIDPFVGADKYGSAVIPQGVLGTIYGVNVVVSSLLGADQYFMYEREGLAVGFQRQPQFDEDKRPEFGPGAMLQVLAAKYGIKALQVGVAGAFQADGSTPLAGTESALIVKDAN